MEIADTIDWRRVKNIMMLTMVSDVYKINRRYDVSRDILSQKIYDSLMYIILGCTDHISRFMQNIVMKKYILIKILKAN